MEEKQHRTKVSRVIQTALNDMGLLMVLVGVRKIHNGQNDKSPGRTPTKERQQQDLSSVLAKFDLDAEDWLELLHSLNQGTVNGQTVEDYLISCLCTKVMRLNQEWVP